MFVETKNITFQKFRVRDRSIDFMTKCWLLFSSKILKLKLNQPSAIIKMKWDLLLAWTLLPENLKFYENSLFFDLCKQINFYSEHPKQGISNLPVTSFIVIFALFVDISEANVSLK